MKIGHFKNSGVNVFRVSAGKDTGKSEVAVGKVLEIHTKGVSDTTWPLKKTPLYDKNTVSQKCKTIVGAYEKYCAHVSLDTLVLCSSHVLSVYMCRFVNCLLLPLQYLSFVKDWSAMDQVSVPAIAGADFDADPLIYLWLRPTKLPIEFQPLLEKAKNIIIVKSTDTSLAKKHGNQYIHSSVFTENEESQRIFRIPSIGVSDPFVKVPDWEFSLSDEVVTSIQQICVKNGKRCIILQGDTVSLNLFISDLALTLYAKNHIQPQKFVFNSYWISHPYYEIENLSIPVCAYRFLQQRNYEKIEVLQKTTGVMEADVFVNEFGGDKKHDIENYFQTSGYFNVERFSFGTDNWDHPDSSSRYIAGRTKTTPKKWQSLTVDDIVQVGNKEPFIEIYC